MRRMYSLAQIQAIVALMAKEGELDFSDVDLKVKTLEQSQPNFSEDILELIRQSANYSTYFKEDTFYAKLIEINDFVWLIISGKATPKTFSGNMSFNFTPSQAFIDRYYSKIKREDGTPLSEIQSYAKYITGEVSPKLNNNAVSQCQVILFSGAGNNSLTLTFYNFGNLTEDQNVWLDIRIPICIF